MNKLKNIAHSYLNLKYHLMHKETATNVLKGIEKVKGKTDPKLIHEANNYALKVLGWKGYAPWLYVYCAISQSFKYGWIPDNYYGKVIVPKMKGNYGIISDYNGLTSRLFDSVNFPDYLYRINGLWLNTDYEVISDKEVESILFKQIDKLVFKMDNSVQGKGVFFIEKNKFNFLELKKFGNGVIQKYIEQHPFFNDIMPNSVATLRITSIVTNDGDVSVRACYLRVARSEDTHVRSSSHIRIPINIETGMLNNYGFDTDWLELNEHPDTYFIFKNKVIPNFEKCINTVLELHKKVTFSRVIGWDVIIDKNNIIQVMEWNGYHNDIKFSEATQGPCFSDLEWEHLWKK